MNNQQLNKSALPIHTHRAIHLTMIKKMKNNVLIRELVGSGRHVLSQLDRSAVFTGSSFIYIYIYMDMTCLRQAKKNKGCVYQKLFPYD